ncbi:hypothetical protein CLU79DRAFT_385194 [Phycomyces nitens]|nr:hypothetical protein CLU79DRAFT_385194 [Phycomyces nitens]
MQEDEDPKAKRKVQNRAAQRAFRERKERYVKDLETKIKQVQDSHLFATSQLFQENQYLRSIIYRLETENFALKGMQINIPGLENVCREQTEHQDNWMANSIQSQQGLFQAAPMPVNVGSMLPTQQQCFPPLGSAPLAPRGKVQDSRNATIQPILAQPQPAYSSYPAPRAPRTVPVPIRPQQTQPPAQQFTFAVSTPATLRATSTTTSQKAISPAPIKPVRLYVDEHHPVTQIRREAQANPPSTSTPTPVSTPTPTPTSTPAPIREPSPPQTDAQMSPETTHSSKNDSVYSHQSDNSPSSLLSFSHMDNYNIFDDQTNQANDPTLFIQEHTNESIEHFLSKPLFDTQGELNMLLMDKDPTTITPNTPSRSTPSPKLPLSPVLSVQRSDRREEAAEKGRQDMSTCELWQRLTQPDKLAHFSVDQLLEVVKKSVQCADTGRAPDEWEMDKMMRQMNQEHL